MVRLTRIYTRLGDAGDTHLGDMSRARKTSPRVVAYGDVDELNSALGVARAEGLTEPVDGWLAVVQNDLFDLGADLCVPPGDEEQQGARLRVAASQVERLEAWCDEVNETLDPRAGLARPAHVAQVRIARVAEAGVDARQADHGPTLAMRRRRGRRGWGRAVSYTHLTLPTKA